MKIYNQLVRDLDSSGGHYSQELSEVDLSDPEDVKVLTNDPDGRGAGASRISRIISIVSRFMSLTCASGGSSSQGLNQWICATTSRSSSIPICAERIASRHFPQQRQRRRWLRE